MQYSDTLGLREMRENTLKHYPLPIYVYQRIENEQQLSYIDLQTAVIETCEVSSSFIITSLSECGNFG